MTDEQAPPTSDELADQGLDAEPTTEVVEHYADSATEAAPTPDLSHVHDDRSGCDPFAPPQPQEAPVGNRWERAGATPEEAAELEATYPDDTLQGESDGDVRERLAELRATEDDVPAPEDEATELADAEQVEDSSTSARMPTDTN